MSNYYNNMGDPEKGKEELPPAYNNNVDNSYSQQPQQQFAQYQQQHPQQQFAQYQQQQSPGIYPHQQNTMMMMTNDTTAHSGGTTIVTTTTAVDASYTYISPLPGVVDLIPPVPLNTPPEISRRWLSSHVGPSIQYDKARYLHDLYENNSPKCKDMCIAMLGFLGLLFLAIAIFIGIPFNIIVIIIEFAIFGSIIYAAYLIMNVCCTYMVCNVCCCGSEETKRRYDQACLSAPYHTAVFRGGEASNNGNNNHIQLEKIRKTIEHLSKDIPSLQFHIRASHQERNGKHSRTVVTYNKSHYIPILHSKYIGAKPDEFINYLQQNVEGEAIVEYRPLLSLPHETQQDYIARLKQMVYDNNRHRDATVTVTLKLKTIDPKGEEEYILDHDIDINKINNNNNNNNQQQQQQITFHYDDQDEDKHDEYVRGGEGEVVMISKSDRPEVVDGEHEYVLHQSVYVPDDDTSSEDDDNNNNQQQQQENDIETGFVNNNNKQKKNKILVNVDEKKQSMLIYEKQINNDNGNDDRGIDENGQFYEMRMDEYGRVRKYVQVDLALMAQGTTSVGKTVNFFTQTSSSSNGNNNPCSSISKCITTPFVWVIGMLFGCAPCFFFCWHHRFSRVIYHAEHAMILPDINEFTAVYASNPDLFEVNEYQQQQSQLVQQVLKYNNDNSTTNNNHNNDINNNQMLSPTAVVMTPSGIDMNDQLPAYQPPNGGF